MARKKEELICFICFSPYIGRRDAGKKCPACIEASKMQSFYKEKSTKPQEKDNNSSNWFLEELKKVQ